jgi:molecular chaperone GrpE
MSSRDKGNGPVREPQDTNGVAGESGAPGQAQQPGLAEQDIDAGALADLEAALENARAELAQTSDRYLRLAAEFDNYRRRTERERAESFGRGQADIVGRLLDFLDDLERVEQGGGAPAAALVEGAQLAFKKLRTVLQSVGLERVETADARFDPTAMEAVATVQAGHPEEDEAVADVFQQGYRFKGQLLRPARVRVKKYEG